ncbi:hypothetical protein D9758_011346 [Tetrapyrgos nigripes]|uniref:Uncharacterized protein n=1 Tax=Tetrapyrgos nigripes TaxID=182062 RepID=A0A8H5G8D5_9AGAR|nr:hypothetical protein D9758_011346 [Tetrapyrgos nigripes]
MKFSLAISTLAIAGLATAVAIEKRETVGAGDVTSLASTGQLVTATQVFPSIIDVEPFMVTVTREHVWTQFPTNTATN